MYASQQDMIDRFGEDELIQLTDRNGTGEIDSDVLDRSIADAAAEIDSYLGGRYTLPLTAVPQVLVRVCADIARYRLYDAQPTDLVASRYKADTQWLTQVANGVVQLGLDPGNQSAAVSDGAQMQSGGRTFDRSDKSFI